MTFPKGGTFTLGGKTFNLSQINSVYAATTKLYAGKQVLLMWDKNGVDGLLE